MTPWGGRGTGVEPRPSDWKVGESIPRCSVLHLKKKNPHKSNISRDVNVWVDESHILVLSNI